MAANGSAVKYYYTVEDANGDIAAVAPVFTPIRFNTSSIARNTTQVDSGELLNRQAPRAHQGTYSVAGEIVSELSSGSFDELLALLVQSEWVGDTLKVGDEPQSIAILKRHTDTGEDVIYRGCYVNSLAVSAQIDARVMMTFGIVGTEAQTYTVPGDAVLQTATTTETMVTSRGEILEGGGEMACVTAADFTLNNGMSAYFGLHKREACGVQNGRFVATGTLSAYRESGDLYAKFLNETETSITQTFEDGIGNAVTFDFPNVGYTQADDAVSGPDAIVNQFTWSAGYDAIDGTTVTITRS